jgi:hypothetical protein
MTAIKQTHNNTQECKSPNRSEAQSGDLAYYGDGDERGDGASFSNVRHGVVEWRLGSKHVYR